MIRDVYPLPAGPVEVAIVFAPKINSLALVVVAGPLFVVALFPLAPASHPASSLHGIPVFVRPDIPPPG